VQDELERLKSAFTMEFCWITMEVGRMHLYLGMQLVFENGRVKVEMTYYLEKILEKFDGLRPEVLPGKKNLFAASLESPALSEKEKASFHTVVAKLLYFSRRARLDIIPAFCFLCTRVQRPTEDDDIKLKRLLGYLLKTKKNNSGVATVTEF
jgi:hypothetical protein